MADITGALARCQDDLIAVRRHLHAHPELSGREYETCGYLGARLAEIGIPYETVGGRSIVATIEGALPGRTVALRGDIDALPIPEATGLSYASQNPGVMHACGHDCHGAMVFAAGKALWALKSELRGTVKLIFQEAEETLSGAKAVIASGLVDDVDNFCMIHVNTYFDAGIFSIGYGPRSAKSAFFKIEVTGKGGHSSMPHRSVNALTVACEIVSAVNHVAAYAFDRQESVVLVPTMLNCGLKENIIPETATLSCHARYFDNALDEAVTDAVVRAAARTAEAFGATVKVETKIAGKPVMNEEKSVDRAMKIVRSMAGDVSLWIDKPTMGGEDFAFFVENKPGVMLALGAAPKGNYTALHSANMTVEESSLASGVEFFVRYALDYLSE